MKKVILILVTFCVVSYAKDIYVGIGPTLRLDRSPLWDDDLSFGWNIFGEWRGLRLDIRNSYFGEKETGLRWNIEFSFMLPNYFLRTLAKDWDIGIDIIHLIFDGIYISPVFTYQFDSYLYNIISYEVTLGYKLEFSKLKLGDWFLELNGSYVPFNSFVWPLYSYRFSFYAGYVF